MSDAVEVMKREEQLPVAVTIYADFETGGISARHPNTQLAAIAVRDADWAELGSFERKLQFKEEDADPEALRIQGYTPERWANAIPEGQAIAQFTKWSERFRCVPMVGKQSGKAYKVAKLAGHNFVAFDLPRLQRCYGTNFFPFLYHAKDTLQLVLWYFDLLHSELPRPENLRLTTVCAYFKIPIDGAHDALKDVRLAAALARAIAGSERNGHA